MGAATEEEAAAYRDGYRAGYAKGIEDGSAQGYSDAKARVWLAYDALAEAREFSNRSVAGMAELASGLTALVGKRS